MRVCLILIAFLWTSAGRVEALTFAVDSTADAVDAVPGDGNCATAGGSCTLRAATQEANASAGTDTIHLPAGMYTLTIPGAGENAGATGDLDFTTGGDVILVGAGAATTIIDGNMLDRVIDIPLNTCCRTTISDVTIQHGSPSNDPPGVVCPNCGGGIKHVGRGLTLEGVVIRECHSPSTGGALGTGFTFPCVIRNSALVDNTAEFGGGISYGADSGTFTLDLTNVTISGNRALVNGGGITSGPGMMRMNNVTITDNTADSDANGTGDGGGLWMEPLTSLFFLAAIAEVSNSIIAGNSDSGGEAPDCRTVMSQIASTGYNLIGDTSGCTVAGTMTGNVLGTSALLAPLADNGGGTPTHALETGSPARDAGNPAAVGSGPNACPAIDQRGVARPFGPRCDTGAFESEAAPTTVGAFRCYKASDLHQPRFNRTAVTLADQFGVENVVAIKPALLCNPAALDGGAIANPVDHLVCYRLKGAKTVVDVAIDNALGMQTLQATKAKLLCVPASKTVLP